MLNSINNNNFEIIKMIHSFEALHVCMFYPLKGLLSSLKNNAQLLSTGVKKLLDFPKQDFLHRVVIIDILKHTFNLAHRLY